jgi:hypothetical protein
MKILQNIARIFVEQLEARLEHEIIEVFTPPPKPARKRKKRKVLNKPQLEHMIQVAPGVQYIPPKKTP